MQFLCLGLNHRTAPLAVREGLYLAAEELPAKLKELVAAPGVDGAVILSTCNRFELYVEQSAPVLTTLHAWLKRFNRGSTIDPSHTYCYQGRSAINHLLEVACGLDSMVKGEPQILGQVRQAYDIAREAGTVTPGLNILFQQALMVGKKVRTVTGINRRAVSVSYAAVELARSCLGDLRGRSVLLVGAGKMSELAAGYLVDHGVSTVLVSNRCYNRAAELARKFAGEAVHFSDLYQYMTRADVVLSSTAASHYVIHPTQVAEVMRQRSYRSLLFIDIAVPRDVDPEVANIPGTKVYTIDDLQGVVHENLAQREKQADEARKLIAQEGERIVEWLRSRTVVPTIRALRERAERIKEEEVERALRRLGGGERERKIVQSLGSSIIHRLLHAPTVNLKAQASRDQDLTVAEQYARVLRDLFGLEASYPDLPAKVKDEIRVRSKK